MLMARRTFAKLKAGEAGQSKNRADWRCSLCHSNPCDCNGKVLTIEQINSHISSLARKRRDHKLEVPDDLVVPNHPDAMNDNDNNDPEEQGADVNDDPMDESGGDSRTMKIEDYLIVEFMHLMCDNSYLE